MAINPFEFFPYKYIEDSDTKSKLSNAYDSATTTHNRFYFLNYSFKKDVYDRYNYIKEYEKNRNLKTMPFNSNTASTEESTKYNLYRNSLYLLYSNILLGEVTNIDSTDYFNVEIGEHYNITPKENVLYIDNNLVFYVYSDGQFDYRQPVFGTYDEDKKIFIPVTSILDVTYSKEKCVYVTIDTNLNLSNDESISNLVFNYFSTTGINCYKYSNNAYTKFDRIVFTNKRKYNALSSDERTFSIYSEENLKSLGTYFNHVFYDITSDISLTDTELNGGMKLCKINTDDFYIDNRTKKVYRYITLDSAPQFTQMKMGTGKYNKYTKVFTPNNEDNIYFTKNDIDYSYGTVYYDSAVDSYFIYDTKKSSYVKLETTEEYSVYEGSLSADTRKFEYGLDYFKLEETSNKNDYYFIDVNSNHISTVDDTSKNYKIYISSSTSGLIEDESIESDFIYYNTTNFVDDINAFIKQYTINIMSLDTYKQNEIYITGEVKDGEFIKSTEDKTNKVYCLIERKENIYSIWNNILKSYPKAETFLDKFYVTEYKYTDGVWGETNYIDFLDRYHKNMSLNKNDLIKETTTA